MKVLLNEMTRMKLGIVNSTEPYSSSNLKSQNLKPQNLSAKEKTKGEKKHDST